MTKKVNKNCVQNINTKYTYRAQKNLFSPHYPFENNLIKSNCNLQNFLEKILDKNFEFRF